MKVVATLVAIMLLASACGGLTHSSGKREPTPTLAPGAPTPRPIGLVEPTDPNAPPAPMITVNSPVSGGQTLVVSVKAGQLAVCSVAYGTLNDSPSQGGRAGTKLAGEDGTVTFTLPISKDYDYPFTGKVTVQCDGSHLATATVVIN